jgi:hypothetical protein
VPRLPFIFLVVFAAMLPGADRLFDDGHWSAPIVLPASPEPGEWYGAQSLADWCERVTGRRPELRQEGEAAIPAEAIFIGRTARSAEAGVLVPEAEGDVAVRRTIRGAVYLLGNSPDATRIAVGRFCEQHLGVFFACPGVRGADWVMLKAVGLPDDDTFRPAFRWREVGGLNEASSDWAYSIGLGRVPAFSHGLHEAFGKKEWQEDPELFPKVDGIRREPRLGAYEPNPNLAHPRAPEVGARHARAYFHAHPGAFSAPLGVNDTLLFDDRVPSEGWYRDRPVRTDYLVGFLNQVADSFWEPTGDVRGERHAIGTLAYLQTLRAPTVRVRPAVFPWVCADRLGYADAAFASQEQSNLRGWVRSGARRVGMYDYWHGAEYAAPRVHLAALAASLGAAQAAGVRGWYSEASPLWAFDAPKFWLAAKLLEDPTQDPEVLMGRWFAAAYGPAAGEMRSAFGAIESAWSRDARKGGQNQFLRHFNDERSALVLSNAEVGAVTSSLAAAQGMLASVADQTSPRQRAYAWRLGQFADAWKLAGTFRRVVVARRAEPGSSAAALAALRELSQAESAGRREEEEFNRKWAAYGVPIRWMRFIGTESRAEWIDRARASGRLDDELASWAQADGSPGQLAWRDAVEPTREADRIEHRDFTDTTSGGSVHLAPSSRNQLTRGREGLRAVAPAGVIGPFPVPAMPAAGNACALRVRLAPTSDPEAQVRLTVRFSGGQPVVRSMLCGPRGGVLFVRVPAGAVAAEYEIAFNGEVFIKEANIDRLVDAAPAPLR